MEFEEHYLVQRVIDHHAFTINEDFISTIDGTAFFVTIQSDIEAHRFELSFSDDSYTGEGTFVGEGMLWSSWQSVSNHLDGSYVISNDMKDGDNISTEKEGYGSDDLLQWTLDEDLLSISKAEYDEILATLP